jgi:hypothetical protein
MKMHLDTQGTPHSLLPVVSCRYTVPACSLTETVQYSTVQYSTVQYNYADRYCDSHWV